MIINERLKLNNILKEGETVASLTHVCMWEKTGWKRITAAEAAKIYPLGRVSSRSGLFMCELCGQYVTLTEGTIKARHFRHSSSEAEKDCPERTFGANFSYSYKENEHELPIRLNVLSQTRISFELGLIRIPEELYDKHYEIIINTGKERYVYSGERITPDAITYVPLGEVPQKEYKLTVKGGNAKIHDYWPGIIKGISPSGSVFDAARGIKLPDDSDVTVGKKYYIVKMNDLQGSSKHLEIQKICTVRNNYERWNVYSVIAKDYDESAAKFFLKFRCRLTEHVASITPVWPIYVENPYVFSHNQTEMTVFVKGNVGFHAFPRTATVEYPCQKDKVYRLYSYGRHQMISVGRSKSLAYTYFMKMPLDQVTDLPKVTVTDVRGNILEGGDTGQLPEEKVVRINAPFDGFLLVLKNNRVVEKRSLSAGKISEIDDITWDSQIKVYVSMDLIWECLFKRGKKETLVEDEVLLQRLMSIAGPEMPISHSLGSVAYRLERYPKVRRWIYDCIRKGTMKRKAFLELQHYLVNMDRH